MSEWRTATIAECASNEPYSTQIGPFGEKIRADIYTPEGAPVLRGTNVNPDGRFHDDDFVFINPDLAEKEFSKFVCEADDVILCHKGTLGKIGVIPRNGRFKKYIMGNSMMKVRCDRTKLHPLYLYYWLCSREGQDYLFSRVSQVGVPQIQRPLSTLREASLPLPPVPEQNAIASVLGAMDDKIELNRRMNETLEALARALFQNWFVDFGPVHAKLDGHGLGILDALFPNAFIENKIGPVPHGWKVGRLADLCNLKRGHDLPTSTRTAGAIPVISSSGISGTHSETNVRGPGVVTGRYGTIGKVFFVETDYWPLNTTLYVEDFKGNPPRFIFHALGEIDYSSYTDKAAVPGVNRNHLHEEPTVIPPMDVRHAFSRFVAPLWSRYAANERESRTLAALRDALLPKLLSGELRVPAAAD